MPVAVALMTCPKSLDPFGKDGAFVLAAFLDCAARLWSLHRGERIHILRGHKNLHLGLRCQRLVY